MCLTHVNPVYCRLIVFSLFLYLQDTIWVWTTGRDISAVWLIFFFLNEMIVVWTLIRSLRTKQKPKKILVCLLCTFPFKSNNCFLFQVIHGTSFAPTCWTSNRDVLCSEPLWAGVKCSLLKAFGCVCSWDFTWRCLQMPLQEAQQEEKRSNPVFSVTHWAYMDHFTNLLDK